MKRFFVLCIIAFISLVMVLVIEKTAYKPKQIEIITLEAGKISLKNVTEEDAYVYVDFEYKNNNSNESKKTKKLFMIHAGKSIVVDSEMFDLDNADIGDILINVYEKDVKNDILEPIKPYFIAILIGSGIWILVIIHKMKRKMKRRRR